MRGTMKLSVFLPFLPKLLYLSFLLHYPAGSSFPLPSSLPCSHFYQAIGHDLIMGFLTLSYPSPYLSGYNTPAGPDNACLRWGQTRN